MRRQTVMRQPSQSASAVGVRITEVPCARPCPGRRSRGWGYYPGGGPGLVLVLLLVGVL